MLLYATALLLPSLLAAGAAGDERAADPPDPLRSVSAARSPPAKETRIINGVEVNGHRYPYAASLQYKRSHFCGGALIAPDVAISAGHCNGGQGLDASYSVVVGRLDLDHRWEGDSVEMREEVRHPQFDLDTVNNDFNLIFLERPVAWEGAGYIRPNDDPAVPFGLGGPSCPGRRGDPLTVVGWGDVDPRDGDRYQTPSDELRETTVYAMKNEDCEKAEGQVDQFFGLPILASLEGEITRNMLCAWAADTDACQGDSGGPLIKTGDDPNGADDVLVGITSWGLGCADENFPGIYARISSQYRWIRREVCARSANPPDWYDCSRDDSPPAGRPTRSPVTRAPTTPAPTRSPLPAGRRRLLVAVQLDASPRETGWTLSALEDGREVVYEVPIGSYANRDAGKVLRYEALVDDERFYNLTIRDLRGDGFAGTLDVLADPDTPDMTALVQEPGFTEISGTAVSHGFYVGSSPERFLTLRFRFDDFAHEVAYEVKCDGDGVIFALAWFETFSYATEETLVIPIYGPERGDQSYTLRLWDAGSDGICCSFGKGGYQLFVGDPGEGNLLRSGGNYGALEKFQFVVEGDPPPTPSPTRKPSKAPTPPPTRRTPPPTREPSTPPTPPPGSRPTTGAPTKIPTLRPILLPVPAVEVRAPSTNPTFPPILLPAVPRSPSASSADAVPSLDKRAPPIEADKKPSSAPIENDAPATFAPSVSRVDVDEVDLIFSAANYTSASGVARSSRAQTPWRTSALRAAAAGFVAGALLF